MLFGLTFKSLSDDELHAGLFYDSFALTLDVGKRTEALGPFFYDEQTDIHHVWAIPPLYSKYVEPDVQSHEDDFLYPLMTYERYNQEYRWQFCQILSFAGGQQQQGDYTTRFTLYPLYFQQHSTGTNGDYTALIPFYGHIENRLFRDKIFFVMFPIYGQSQKKDVVTDNYLFPFFHVRHGDGLYGWQFWPLVGNEHKDVTTRTNGFGDVSIVGGHDEFFALWPIYFHYNTGIGTDDPEKFRAVLPLYDYARSPLRDSTTVLWPFFSWVEDRGKQYHEWQGPWPFVIFADGAGKTTRRVWPLFSQSHDKFKESNSYLWPVYTYRRTHSDPLDRRRTRIAFTSSKTPLKKTLPPVSRNTGWMHYRFSLTFAISTGTIGCKFSRRLSRCCPATGGSNGTGRRCGRFGFPKIIRRPARAASHCFGIYTGTKARLRRKNARSCSVFFSINLIAK